MKNTPICKELIIQSLYYLPLFKNEKKWTKFSNTYWFNILCYKYENYNKYPDNKICSIDIGCKNFISLYGLNGICYKIKSDYKIIDNILQNPNISYQNKDKLNLLDQLSDNPKQDSKQIYETINLNTNPYKKPISPVTQFISPDIKLQETKNVIISNEIKENPLSPQEIRMKKIELLRKLSEIKVKGYQLSKDYDFNSQLEEMEYEYALLRSFVDKRNGVKIFKNSLLQFVSVVEFLNDKYDPFDFQLSGWSEHLTIEVDNWEDVMEELYEKYKGKGRKMAPEIKLLYLIIASASAFHFSKSYASKLPGLDSILSSNPGLLNKIINGNSKESSQFMTPQELNIEKQKEKIKKNEIDNKKSKEDALNECFENIKYNNEKFPGVFLKFKIGTVILFHSGKLVIVGCKNIENIECLISKICAHI